MWRRWNDEAVIIWARRLFWGYDDVIHEFENKLMPVLKIWYLTDFRVRSRRRKNRKENARRRNEDLELDTLFSGIDS